MTDQDTDETETEEESPEVDPSPAEEPDAVADLSHRVEEMEAEMESTNTQLRSIEDGQESVAEAVDEMQDTVRQLMGVYEQVTEDVNPFKDDSPDGVGFEFGEFDEGEEPATTDGGEPDDESVGVDDLRQTAGDEATDAREYQEGEPDQEPDELGEAGSELPLGQVAIDSDRRGDPTPVGLVDSYATDILVFEWLSELIRASSPAAAINAISYYNEIGWISDAAESYLLDVLSGPHLDAGIDPNEPASLTAADHAESYAYIRKLDAISEMDPTQR